MPRRAAKKDANHNSIGDHLRSLGWSVLDLSKAGDGIPDMAVGKPGYAALVECKDGSKPPSKQRLTEDQQRIVNEWEGPYVVALSPEDAERQLEGLYLTRYLHHVELRKCSIPSHAHAYMRRVGRDGWVCARCESERSNP